MKKYRVTTKITFDLTVPDGFELNESKKYKLKQGIALVLDNGTDSEFSNFKVGAIKVEDLYS